jgi:hypothetical protein
MEAIQAAFLAIEGDLVSRFPTRPSNFKKLRQICNPGKASTLTKAQFTEGCWLIDEALRAQQASTVART